MVGGGVIGLAIAWRAAHRGLRTVLLEREQLAKAATHVAAGMLAPVSEADPQELPVLQFGLASARAYPDFVAELRQRTDVDPGYLECGTLAVARDADEAEALERELLLRHRLELGAERLRPSAARRLEPALAPIVRLGLDMPQDHVIDPRRLAGALEAAARAAGAELRTGAEVAAVAVARERVTGVELAGGERVVADQVVVAAGAWSGDLEGVPAPAQPRVRPVKGQIARLHDPAGPGLLTRVIRMATGYVVPRGDGRYVLGATMEERGFDDTVTAGAIFELLRDAIELVPGLGDLAIDELSVGFRPALPDNAPAIGPGALPGLHWATGHYRHGILFAPLTAELVVAGLMGEPHAELPEAFSPGREGPLTAGGRRWS